jgi:hypothetical protein
VSYCLSSYAGRAEKSSRSVCFFPQPHLCSMCCVNYVQVCMHAVILNFLLSIPPLYSTDREWHTSLGADCWTISLECCLTTSMLLWTCLPQDGSCLQSLSGSRHSLIFHRCGYSLYKPHIANMIHYYTFSPSLWHTLRIRQLRSDVSLLMKTALDDHIVYGLQGLDPPHC